jgi:hypothetical protein
MGVVQPVVVERRQSVICLTVMATSGSNQQSYLLHDSRLNLNEGQGKALDLAVKSQYVSADSAEAAPAHSEGSAQGVRTLAAAITEDSNSSEASGGDSAMSIVDDEERSEEKESEDVRHDTSSGGMAMSSTEDVVDHPHPPPPPSQQLPK